MKLRKGVKRAAGFDKATLGRLPTSERYAGMMIKVRGGFVRVRIEDLLHDSHSEPCPA